MNGIILIYHILEILTQRFLSIEEFNLKQYFNLNIGISIFDQNQNYHCKWKVSLESTFISYWRKRNIAHFEFFSTIFSLWQLKEADYIIVKTIKMKHKITLWFFFQHVAFIQRLWKWKNLHLLSLGPDYKNHNNPNSFLKKNSRVSVSEIRSYVFPASFSNFFNVYHLGMSQISIFKRNLQKNLQFVRNGWFIQYLLVSITL